MFQEVASGAQTDRAQLRRLLETLIPGDVVTVTRLDRLARSTRDLLKRTPGPRDCKASQSPPRHALSGLDFITGLGLSLGVVRIQLSDIITE